jgi:ferredoxin
MDDFARDAAQKLEGLAALPAVPVSVAGEEPIRPYYTPRDRHGAPINILKVKPKTNMTLCGGCGLCAARCPMGSIDPTDVSQVKGICIKCCACVKGCPSGAKYFDDPGYLYHQHELEEIYARPAENALFI